MKALSEGVALVRPNKVITEKIYNISGRVQIQMAILGHLPILTLEGCHTPGAEYNLKSANPWLSLNIFLKPLFFQIILPFRGYEKNAYEVGSFLRLRINLKKELLIRFSERTFI